MPGQKGQRGGVQSGRGGGDDLSALMGRAALPVRHDAACPGHHSCRSADIIGMQPRLDHKIDLAKGQQTIAPPAKKAKVMEPSNAPPAPKAEEAAKPPAAPAEEDEVEDWYAKATTPPVPAP